MNKGISNYSSDNGICYLVQTEGYQYVYQVQDGNIYCGASVYDTCDKGMVGGEQYFRIRYNNGQAEA